MQSFSKYFQPRANCVQEWRKLSCNPAPRKSALLKARGSKLHTLYLCDRGKALLLGLGLLYIMMRIGPSCQKMYQQSSNLGKVTIGRIPWTRIVNQNGSTVSATRHLKAKYFPVPIWKDAATSLEQIPLFVCFHQCNSNKRRWGHQDNLSPCPGLHSKHWIN